MDWLQPKDLLASFLLDLLQVWLFSLYFQLHIHKMGWDFLFLFFSIILCEESNCVCVHVHMHVLNVFMYAGATACKWRAEDSSYLPPVLEIAPLLMVTVVFKLASPQASGDSPVSISYLQRGSCWDYRCLCCRVLEIMT